MFNLTNSKLAFIGHSVVVGPGASIPTNVAWPSQLGFGTQALAIRSGSSDARISLGTGWGPQNYGAGHSSSWHADTGVTAAMTVTLGEEFDSYTVFYMKHGASPGGFSAVATGGTPVTASSSGSGGVDSITVTPNSPSSSNVVTITPDGTGQNFILGVLGNSSALRVLNAGVLSTYAYGNATGSWSATPGEGASPLQFIDALEADLYVIMLGINDAVADISVVNYISGMTAIIERCKATGADVVVCVEPPINASNYSAAATRLADYATALETLCGDEEVDFYDFRPLFDNAFKSAWMGDDFHPNATGAAAMGAAFGTHLEDLVGAGPTETVIDDPTLQIVKRSGDVFLRWTDEDTTKYEVQLATE